MCVYDRLPLRVAVTRLLEAQDKLERNWEHLFPEAKTDECGRHWQAGMDIDNVREGIWELLYALGMVLPNAKGRPHDH